MMITRISSPDGKNNKLQPTNNQDRNRSSLLACIWLGSMAISFAIGTNYSTTIRVLAGTARTELFLTASSWSQSPSDRLAQLQVVEHTEVPSSPTNDEVELPRPKPRPVQQSILSWRKVTKRQESTQKDATATTTTTTTTTSTTTTTTTSTVRNNLKYEEMLVHPILFSHPEPKRVAIYSSTPEGLLEQVRKHSTVDRIMVFTDDHVVAAAPENSQQHLGRKGKPLIAWVSKGSIPSQTKFDVAIIDQGFNPSMTPELWYHHLDGNGTLVEHLMDDPAPRFNQTNQLVEAGFERVIDYEVHTSKGTIIGRKTMDRFAVAFKSDCTRAEWHLNEAQLQCILHERLVRVEGDDNDTTSFHPLQYFDSSAMASIAFPSKPTASEYCTWHNPTPGACLKGHGWDPNLLDVPIEQIQVAKSGMGEYSGRGLFAKVDIPSGSYIALKSSSEAIRLSWQSYEIMDDLEAVEIYKTHDSAVLYSYFEGYGFLEEPFGEPECTVDSAILTFSNHGCNGTFNIGLASEFHELNVDPDHVPIPIEYGYKGSAKYNPMEERIQLIEAVTTMTSKDISTGEELLDNYLDFGGAKYFRENVISLREQCAGAAIGEVEKYQNKVLHDEH